MSASDVAEVVRRVDVLYVCLRLLLVGRDFLGNDLPFINVEPLHCHHAGTDGPQGDVVGQAFARREVEARFERILPRVGHLERHPAAGNVGEAVYSELVGDGADSPALDRDRGVAYILPRVQLDPAGYGARLRGIRSVEGCRYSPGETCPDDIQRRGI